MSLLWEWSTKICSSGFAWTCSLQWQIQSKSYIDCFKLSLHSSCGTTTERTCGNVTVLDLFIIPCSKAIYCPIFFTLCWKSMLFNLHILFFTWKNNLTWWSAHMLLQLLILIFLKAWALKGVKRTNWSKKGGKSGI